MIKSMTGFGKAEFNENGVNITVEIQSVNGRFLDLKARLPRFLAEYETELRSIVQEYIDRGRVNLTVGIDKPGLTAGEIEVNHEAAALYVKLIGDLAKEFGLKENLDARSLLTMPDILVRKESETDGADIWEKTLGVVRKALESHLEMRSSEGKALESDLKKRLDAIESSLAEIENRVPEAVKQNSTRLRAKIDTLLGDTTFDDGRLALEIALYADRVDVTEECVRLKSHIGQFNKEINSKKTSGRKLSFLIQEMNREVNTIGSKVMDAGICQIVVGIKEELEKIREQAENIE